MAPKKLPYNRLKKSARNYRDNPLSRVKKNETTAKLGRTQANRDYRASLNRARRADGNYGKGGKDYSHTRKGTLVREDPSKNRARNRGKR